MLFALQRLGGFFAILLIALHGAPSVSAAEPAAKLELRPRDHIVFVGNTFAERLGLFGDFQAILAARFPDHQFVFRDMGWSADTLESQPRPFQFGDMPSHLAEAKADVIFLCYGMNESFAGEAGLPRFERDLRETIDQLRDHKFNGDSPPRLVLVTPIPHERLGDKLPDPAAHNRQLRLYADAMRKVAADKKVPLVDLYTSLLPLEAEKSAEPLTFNGIHLTHYGDWATAHVMMDQLGLTAEPARIEIDAQSVHAAAKGGTVGAVESAGGTLRFSFAPATLPPPPPPAEKARVHAELAERFPTVSVKNLQPGRYELKIDGHAVATADAAGWAAGVRLTADPAQAAAEKLRLAEVERDQQFFYRWRAVNGEYIYGRRKEPFGVISFPPEMKKLDEIIAGLDRRCCELAKPPGAEAFEISRTGE